MQCPNCRFENAEHATKCARCGIVLNLRDVDLSGPQPRPPARKKALPRGIVGGVIVAQFLLGMLLVGAIVMPGLSRLRDKARQTSCLANLNQLNLAMLMYAKDHAEVMPPASNWCDLTHVYAQNRVVYVCPAAFGAVGTYAMNDAVSGRNLSTIPTPATAVCLFDSTTGWNMHGGPSLIANRHSGGANLSFADGHSKWVASGSVSSYTWTVSAPPAASGASGGP